MRRNSGLTKPGLRGLVLAVSLAVAWGGSPQPARAWGRIGHRAAARLAMSRLTPEARAAVAALLDPGEDLADASTWADEHRRGMPESAPWHYVNVPITEDRYSEKFCPEEGCVVSKVRDFQAILSDPNASRADRRQALRFLVHFIEDLHQPVHVGERHDRGGNDLQLRFFDQGSNLHRIWDSGIIEHHSEDEAVWVEEISAEATPENVEKWSEGDVEDWANESLAEAKKAYRVPGKDTLLKPGTKLGEAYQKLAEPVARRRLAQAGVRLANVLNECFR